MGKMRKKVLLIGWDSADWKIINRLMDKGEMPALKSMVEKGVMGNISTLEPAYSPMLWTTIATGKHADKHGILGFSEPTPDHSAIRPVSTSSRKVKAIWNILTQNGYKTHVINWWPSYPAEPVNGIYISNLLPKISSYNLDHWPLPPDSVHPPELQNLFSHFRIHPLELTLQHLQPFIPDIESNRSAVNKKTESIAKIVAEASTIQGAATLAIEQEEWDFAAIYWETIDHFCHAFMNYSSPKMKGIKDEDFQKYQYVVDGAYKLMDLMLSRLLKMIDKNCTVILLSDHGFKSEDLRSPYTPNEPAGPAHHHRNVGIFCAMGPDIRNDEIIYGASLLDITPTILSIMGLPIGEDMDGKPLIEIFKTQPEIETIPSWEEVPGDCGMLPDDKRDLDPVQSAEAITQLIALGYIDDPGEDITKAVEKTIDELDYNLAQVYFNSDRFHLAKPLLAKLFNKYPHRGRYLFKLVSCYLNEGDFNQVQIVINQFKSSAPLKILNNDKFDSIKRRKVPEILNNKEKKQWIHDNKTIPLKESIQAKNDLFQLKITEGDVLLKQGKNRKALQKYREIEKEAPVTKSSLIQMGNAFLKLRQWRDAEKMFLEVIKIDSEHQNAYLGLGISQYHQQKQEEALDNLLNSASLNFYNPVTHFNIGRTLVSLFEFENAAQAYETALKINPNFGIARNNLIELYENQLIKPEKALAFRMKSEKNESENLLTSQIDESLIIRPVSTVFDSTSIIVVSGLPRSGTSMMMQMLEAGGIQIYTDEARKADENNPKGYFEHEKVKQLVRNTQWLEEATGKALKIVLPLLYKIPPSFNYKVIFMQRDIKEIIESQHQMLVRNKKIKEGDYALVIEETYQNYLNRLKTWSTKNKNIELLQVDYTETLKNPVEVAKKIIAFLNIEPDPEKMAASIDPQLQRVKLKIK
jgi:predicted AlkP superfamily phosphohydrolase/phosphomutase/tetratricopeptide (TPR) repeat protein